MSALPLGYYVALQGCPSAHGVSTGYIVVYPIVFVYSTVRMQYVVPPWPMCRDSSGDLKRHSQRKSSDTTVMPLVMYCWSVCSTVHCPMRKIPHLLDESWTDHHLPVPRQRHILRASGACDGLKILGTHILHCRAADSLTHNMPDKLSMCDDSESNCIVHQVK